MITTLTEANALNTVKNRTQSPRKLGSDYIKEERSWRQENPSFGLKAP